MKLKEFRSIEDADRWIRDFNVQVISIHPFQGFHGTYVVIAYK